MGVICNMQIFNWGKGVCVKRRGVCPKTLPCSGAAEWKLICAVPSDIYNIYRGARNEEIHLVCSLLNDLDSIICGFGFYLYQFYFTPFIN